jgi:hypothetical protein
VSAANEEERKRLETQYRDRIQQFDEKLRDVSYAEQGAGSLCAGPVFATLQRRDTGSSCTALTSFFCALLASHRPTAAPEGA